MEKSEDGADVTVFTARPGEDYHRRSLRILREGPEPSGTGRGAGVGLISLGALAMVVAFTLEILASIPSIVLLAVGIYLLGRRPGRADGGPCGAVRVRIVEGLHAKLYSRDRGEETVFGSANLTGSGMWRNLEVIGWR